MSSPIPKMSKLPREHQCACRIAIALCVPGRKVMWTHKLKKDGKEGRHVASAAGRHIVVTWKHSNVERLGKITTGVIFMAAVRHCDLHTCDTVPLCDLRDNGNIDVYTPKGKFEKTVNLADAVANTLLDAMRDPKKYERELLDPKIWKPNVGP